MSKGYKDGVGRHQRVFNMMRKKVPDIGYTGVCWVDAFTCMYRLYLDFIEHDQAGIGDGWERETREYIRPGFPAFDLNAYIYGEANSVERQMDVLLNIIGAVSEDYLQVRLSVVWQNASEKQLTMKAMFDEGWKAVTFGSDQIMMDWCRKRFEEGYWMGNPVRGIGPDSVKFLMGDLKAELRRTPEGMDLYLSKEGTRVQSLRLMSRERKVGDCRWTEVRAVIPQSLLEDGHAMVHGLLSPDDLPTVYMREDGKLYCRECRCTVPNTANHEMRREGAYAHSHVCGIRAEGEVYDD